MQDISRIGVLQQYQNLSDAPLGLPKASKFVVINEGYKEYRVDENGNYIINQGGGGGDVNNKGFYATPLALTTAHPTGVNGDYARVLSTTSIWMWSNIAWVDTEADISGITELTFNDTINASATKVIELITKTPNKSNFNVKVNATDGLKIIRYIFDIFHPNANPNGIVYDDGFYTNVGDENLNFLSFQDVTSTSSGKISLSFTNLIASNINLTFYII